MLLSKQNSNNNFPFLFTVFFCSSIIFYSWIHITHIFETIPEIFSEIILGIYKSTLNSRGISLLYHTVYVLIWTFYWLVSNFQFFLVHFSYYFKYAIIFKLLWLKLEEGSVPISERSLYTFAHRNWYSYVLLVHSSNRLVISTINAGVSLK